MNLKPRLAKGCGSELQHQMRVGSWRGRHWMERQPACHAQANDQLPGRFQGHDDAFAPAVDGANPKAGEQLTKIRAGRLNDIGTEQVGRDDPGVHGTRAQGPDNGLDFREFGHNW